MMKLTTSAVLRTIQRKFCLPRPRNVALTQQTPTADRSPSALTIAGSDSGGGAGIQADLKTFAAHDIHGLSAIAALTAQNTRGVSAVHVPPREFLTAQLDACFDDFDIRATKIGMLADAGVVQLVAQALRRHGARYVVLDPVMIASSGARLLAADAVHALRQELIPLASVLTPNLPEAEALLGSSIRHPDDMRQAARALLELGSRSVLLKGGHLPSGDAIDLYVDAETCVEMRHERLAVAGHGTGCTLSAAIAARLARGDDRVAACRAACDYVHAALRRSYLPGRGELSVLGHFRAAREAWVSR
jgi:hydroxymethylpyrimidine/phosphomethylpyrimidine kinase